MRNFLVVQTLENPAKNIAVRVDDIDKGDEGCMVWTRRLADTGHPIGFPCKANFFDVVAILNGAE